MITISIDESNGFETYSESDVFSPIYVAGVIYNDNGYDRDEANERKRICAFYKRAIEEVSDGSSKFSFPSSLHSNGDTERDKKVVHPVKTAVTRHLEEFIQSGTFNGEELVPSERLGEYYLYVSVKSQKGISLFTYDNSSDLIKDDFASNLYFHMSTNIVNRLVSHNPVISSVDDVILNLATRRTDYISKNSATSQQYRSIGYVSEPNGDYDQFCVASPDMYRTSISKEMVRSGKTNTKVKYLKVVPITYEENFAYTNAFLYLADTLCSNLVYRKRIATVETCLTEFTSELNRLNNPDRNLVFFYDDIDVKFNTAWQLYEDGFYFKVLELAFQVKGKDDVIAKFYSERWFSLLEEKICASSNLEYFVDAVSKLQNYMFSSSYSQEFGKYAYEILFKMSESLINKNYSGIAFDKALSILYSAGVSVYCHIGSSTKAVECYELFKNYAGLLGTDDITFLLLRLSVCCCDSFDFEEAKKYADEAIEIIEMNIAMCKDVPLFSNQDYLMLDLGKAYSQLAQVYAYCDKEKAESAFLKALEYIPDNTPDRRITESYMLHHYIDTGNFEKYSALAIQYFGGEKSYSKQYKYMCENSFEMNSLYNYRYALYILIKGIYRFGPSKVSDVLFEKFINLGPELYKYAKKKKNEQYDKKTLLKGHPFEFINKYIALIILEKSKDVELAERFITKADECFDEKDKGETISLILSVNRIEFYSKIENQDKVSRAVLEAREIIATNFDSLKYLLDYDDEEFITRLSEKLTYMYN